MNNFRITPWLSVHHGREAISFYQQAFQAVEVYHLDGPDNTVVSKLSIEDAEFWISDESPDNPSPRTLRGITSRIILITNIPEIVFERALAAGATLVYPIAEEHGWKLGRLADPFGHHWEIGHPLA
jgi:PhnB protein